MNIIALSEPHGLMAFCDAEELPETVKALTEETLKNEIVPRSITFSFYDEVYYEVTLWGDK